MDLISLEYHMLKLDRGLANHIRQFNAHMQRVEKALGLEPLPSSNNAGFNNGSSNMYQQQYEYQQPPGGPSPSTFHPPGSANGGSPSWGHHAGAPWWEGGYGMFAGDEYVRQDLVPELPGSGHLSGMPPVGSASYCPPPSGRDDAWQGGGGGWTGRSGGGRCDATWGPPPPGVAPRTSSRPIMEQQQFSSNHGSSSSKEAPDGEEEPGKQKPEGEAVVSRSGVGGFSRRRRKSSLEQLMDEQEKIAAG